MESVNGLPAPTERRLETFLDGWMVENDVPGLSVAVLDRDGLRYTEGMGARNVASQAPATSETLYSVASVTKTFTALATLQLVERGELALDDEIREYTEFWTDVPGDPITVHELLAHDSGMPLDYAGAGIWVRAETVGLPRRDARRAHRNCGCLPGVRRDAPRTRAGCHHRCQHAGGRRR